MLILRPSRCGDVAADLKSARWLHALATEFRTCGKGQADPGNASKGTAWQVAIARTLRSTVAPSDRWLAHQLHLGKPATVRVDLSREN